MKKIRLLFVVFFVILCSGCTTMVEPKSDTSSSPAEAKKASSETIGAQTTATLQYDASVISANDMSGASTVS
jgi:uncharacterized protein YceK